MTAQPAILLDVPKQARYQVFVINDESQLDAVLRKIAAQIDGMNVVLGLGRNVITALGKEVPGLESFPEYQNTPIASSSTPGDLLCWLRGEDRGDLLQKSREIETLLMPAFKLHNTVDAFKYKDGRDLTGYEDGTENPEGDAAVEAAIVCDQSEDINGSSFVAVQQWQHDLTHFESLDKQSQDDIIGRERISNEEMDNAPESAHVKRTEQEGFDPEAFVLRRSMPWVENQRAGLMFVAFGKSFDAFSVQWKRMIGADDNLTDGLFEFSKPITSHYFWCPPISNSGLNLAHILD